MLMTEPPEKVLSGNKGFWVKPFTDGSRYNPLYWALGEAH